LKVIALNLLLRIKLNFSIIKVVYKNMVYYLTNFDIESKKIIFALNKINRKWEEHSNLEKHEK
jgi:hypothetical protein